MKLIYQSFNYDSFKLFGVVLNETIQFYDYWFPWNGVVNFKHNCIVPPDNRVFSNNKYVVESVDGNKFESIVQCYEDDLKNRNKMLLFSLRKKGSINFLSHIKYKENELIKN